MEFFYIANHSTTENWLQENLKLSNIHEFCYTIRQIGGDEVTGRVDTVWGEFEIHRELIRGGVRYSLASCPNALAWTITTGFPPAPDKIVIHGTINRIEAASGLVESIKEFLADWKEGLEE